MAELDYYGVLGLTPACCDPDVGRAFRRLALQLHPRRGRPGSERLFALVAEAYDVLGDPERRAVYDQFGEAGLKRGWAPGRPGYAFHGDPLRTYREFFGTDSPYADLLDSVRGPPWSSGLPGPRAKGADHRRPLPLTLEEVFHGATKRLRVNRRVLEPADGSATEARTLVLTAEVLPGLPAGTELRFPQAGDQGVGVTPADLVLVTQDRPHDRFSREGHNLVMVHTLELQDALTGCTVVVSTLDDKTLRVPITEVTAPGYQKVVPGEGMPHATDRHQRGDLIIRFNVKYPQYLSEASRRLVQTALKKKAWRNQPEDIYRIIMQDKMRRITDKEWVQD
ncbi:dnaJ homolog subfamily B member 13-like isoform X1 [Bacillus rossius redtenbacheri]|uniref:dnaJ homolog subfamily B member 13-like isoform X1 n=1 Tax=Bacillus rossius redtenbacheri TaxID=93214 RepID=UPI002FDE5364